MSTTQGYLKTKGGREGEEGGEREREFYQQLQNLTNIRFISGLITTLLPLIPTQSSITPCPTSLLHQLATISLPITFFSAFSSLALAAVGDERAGSAASQAAHPHQRQHPTLQASSLAADGGKDGVLRDPGNSNRDRRTPGRGGGRGQGADVGAAAAAE